MDPLGPVLIQPGLPGRSSNSEKFPRMTLTPCDAAAASLASPQAPEGIQGALHRVVSSIHMLGEALCAWKGCRLMSPHRKKKNPSGDSRLIVA